ncbi:MAG: hypothetical protein JWN43_126, partial [Gammaproteobacteria bacterium]|nr:hypothetical protein [Gammaproteobacteria bacterium]
MNLQDDNRQVTRPPSVPMPAPAPPSRGMALQQRAERMLVRVGPQVRYQVMRVGPAGLTGLGVLLAAGIAAAALLLPARQSVLTLSNELAKAGHVMPAAINPERSPQQFAATLPTREQIP